MSRSKSSDSRGSLLQSVLSILLVLTFAAPPHAFALRQLNAGMEESPVNQELRQIFSGLEELNGPNDVLRILTRFPPELATQKLIEAAGWNSQPSDYSRQAVQFLVEEYALRKDTQDAVRSIGKTAAFLLEGSREDLTVVMKLYKLLTSQPIDSPATMAGKLSGILSKKRLGSIRWRSGDQPKNVDPGADVKDLLESALIFRPEPPAPLLDGVVVEALIRKQATVILLGSFLKFLNTSSDIDLVFYWPEVGWVLLEIPLDNQDASLAWLGKDPSAMPHFGVLSLRLPANRVFDFSSRNDWSVQTETLLELFQKNHYYRAQLASGTGSSQKLSITQLVTLAAAKQQEEISASSLQSGGKKGSFSAGMEEGRMPGRDPAHDDSEVIRRVIQDARQFIAGFPLHGESALESYLNGKLEPSVAVRKLTEDQDNLGGHLAETTVRGILIQTWLAAEYDLPWNAASILTNGAIAGKRMNAITELILEQAGFGELNADYDHAIEVAKLFIGRPTQSMAMDVLNLVQEAAETGQWSSIPDHAIQWQESFAVLALLAAKRVKIEPQALRQYVWKLIELLVKDSDLNLEEPFSLSAGLLDRAIGQHLTSLQREAIPVALLSGIQVADPSDSRYYQSLHTLGAVGADFLSQVARTVAADVSGESATALTLAANESSESARESVNGLLVGQGFGLVWQKEILEGYFHAGLEESASVPTTDDLEATNDENARRLAQDARAAGYSHVALIPKDLIDATSDFEELVVTLFGQENVTTKAITVLTPDEGLTLRVYPNYIPTEPGKIAGFVQEHVKNVQMPVVALDATLEDVVAGILPADHPLTLLLDSEEHHLMPYRKALATLLAHPPKEGLRNLILKLTQGSVRPVTIQGRDYVAIFA